MYLNSHKATLTLYFEVPLHATRIYSPYHAHSFFRKRYKKSAACYASAAGRTYRASALSKTSPRRVSPTALCHPVAATALTRRKIGALLALTRRAPRSAALRSTPRDELPAPAYTITSNTLSLTLPSSSVCLIRIVLSSYGRECSSLYFSLSAYSGRCVSSGLPTPSIHGPIR